MFRKWIISWMVLGVFNLLRHKAQGVAPVSLSCADGWSLVGATCNKVYNKSLTWNGALQACQQYGAQLAQLRDAQINNDIGLLAKHSLVSDFWIGLSADANVTTEYSAEWTDGTLWTLFQGFWSSNQPKIVDDGCVSVAENTVYFRWTLGVCENKKPFVCQYSACVSGSFRCSDNTCLPASHSCDGKEDCKDGLDEINCPSLCKYYYQNDSGSFNSTGYPVSYSAKTYCTWTIETSIGSVTEITFSDLDTELGKDEVVIFGGGKSEASSFVLKHMSGTSNTTSVRSVNNFIIIRFTSDGSTQRKGFRASWRAVYAQDSGEKLIANKFKQFITSFQYPVSYLPNQESTYLITTKQPRQIIHLQVIDFDLAKDDYVMVYDGIDATAPLLSQLSKSSHSVLSTGSNMFLFFKTQQLISLGKRGFNFSYETGCLSTLGEDSGEITSPGYPNLNYPNSLVCIWQIKTKSGKGISLQWDQNFDIDMSDKLQMFLGPQWNVSSVALASTNGTSVTQVQNLTVPSGQIVIHFSTNAILTAKGFRIIYSADCVRPTLNNNTLVQPVNFSQTFGSALVITCKTGYTFDSEEFYISGQKSMTNVTMVCNFGGQWNVQRTPSCTPMYCGSPPSIPYGFVHSSTGVVFGSEVKYGCLNGYVLSQGNTSQCQSDGAWSIPPTCVALPSCFNGNISIANGQVTSKNGTLQDKLYIFQCLPGFQLKGSSAVYCSNGIWSSDLPSCQRQLCLVPYVPYAMVQVNSSIVEFNTTVNVECINGYVIQGTLTNKTVTITCLSNQTFGTLPICEVSSVNYCQPFPCSVNETCIKKIGGYECQCRDGFSKRNGFCQDINECTQTNHSCSQVCINLVGSYACSCQNGYSLYEANGTNGYYIPPGETGLIPGDVYFINHTCVLKKCTVFNITSGYITNPQLTYHVNDTMTFECNYGYIPSNDVKKATCLENLSWTPAFPSCKVAQCPPDLLASVAHPPAQVIPNGSVDFMSNVTIVCSRQLSIQDNRTRTCMYDPGTLTYKLIGDSYDCGDTPSSCESPLAYFTNIFTDPDIKNVTSFNNGYIIRMECQLPYFSSNQKPSFNATCLNGVWDFQHVYCILGYCPSPVVPLNGLAHITGYEDEDVATYSCLNDGYYPSENLTICNLPIEDNFLEWNVSSVYCKDSQDHCLPGLTGNYCEIAVGNCSSTGCYNNGTCNKTSNGNYLCLCPSGTTGDFCQTTVGSCRNDSCNYHGTCIDSSGNISCLCTEGFTGSRCETTEVSACNRISCDVNGTRYCQPLDLFYAVCVCKPGYKGLKCSQLIDSFAASCASNPCRNSGICEMVGLSYACHCQTGFKGSNCQTPELTCAQQNCSNATCVDDYITGLPLCNCWPGYTQGPVCNFEYTANQTMLGHGEPLNNFSYRACHEHCLLLDQCAGFTFAPYSPQKLGNCTVLMAINGTTKYLSNTVLAKKVCQYISENTFYSPWITPRGSENGFDVALVNLSNVFEEPICSWTQPLTSECRSRNTSQTLPCGNNRVVCKDNQSCFDVEMRFLCAKSRVFANKSCTLRDVCSDIMPCVRGECELTGLAISPYRCLCPDGYEGANCQLQKNPCPTSNSSLCTCPMGFIGVKCDINIDDCLTSACNTAGTETCIDGNNTYNCQCYSNYTGSMCERLVDDCLSQPCLHGGNCSFLGGNVSCSCPAGWTGPRCESAVKYCNSSSCKGGADCIDLSYDFICNCPSQTYEKTCELVPDLCAVASPCINGVQCTNSGSNCTCTQGCQFYQYNTCNQTTCQNGGSCFANITTPPTCACSKDYTGKYCETPVDNCNEKNCSSSAVCIYGISQSYCRCPVGKQGSQCLDDISDDFDLCIRPSADISSISLPYPAFYNDTGGFTVKLWVKYYRSLSLGHFLTLYYIWGNYINATKGDLIFAMDQTGMQLHNLTSVQYINQSINDGNWHYILVSWRKDIGQVEVAIDYQRNLVFRGYFQGTAFNGGGFLAIVGSSQEDGQKFTGCISKLDMLNRSVDTTSELKSMEANPGTYVGNVFRWGEVQPSGNVLVIHPSNSSLVKCSGTGISSCPPDVMPPKVIFCPSNLAISSAETNTSASWPIPKFEDATNVSCNYQPGDLLSQGSHIVICVATDVAGNSAVCTFTVYIGTSFCPALKSPRGNGTDVCDSVNNFTYCSMNCLAQGSSLTQAIPFIYTCGPDGGWENLREMDGIFPSCGKASNETKVDIMMTLSYQFNETNCTTITDSLTNKTRQALVQLQKSKGNGLCLMENCFDIDISVNCTQPMDTTVQILFQNVSSYLNSSGVPIKTEDVLKVAVLDEDKFFFPDVVLALLMDKDEFNLDVSIVCSSGQVVRDGLCVSCGPGTYYSTSKKMCDNCPVGQYAEGYGQMSCISCPQGKTTRAKGSDSNLDCTTNCSSGYEFKVLNSSCVPCPRGYYRDAANTSSDSCLMCPKEFITLGEAVVSPSQCNIRNCSDLGKFRNTVTNECEVCPIGTYSDKKWQDACLACPVGLTTLSTGSSSVSLCYTKCAAGQYYNISHGQCLLCDAGQYQSSEGQFSCLQCPSNQLSVESRISCAVSCPVGQENVNNICQSCAKGYYKSNDGISQCLQCPNGTDTYANGAKALAECNATMATSPRTGSSKNNALIIGLVVGLFAFFLLLVPLLVVLFKRYKARKALSTTTSVDDMSPVGGSMTTNHSMLITRANLKAVPEEYDSAFDPAFYHSKPASQTNVETEGSQIYLTWNNKYNL